MTERKRLSSTRDIEKAGAAHVEIDTKGTVIILKDPYINGMVAALTAQQLAQCVQDVIRWQDEGLLGAGVLFKLATHVVAEMGLDRASSMQRLEAAVLREVSLRFVAMHTGLPNDNIGHERCT